MTFFESIEASCLLLGSLLLMISCLGVMRLPDIFCRVHALAKSMPLAVNLILLGVWIDLGPEVVGYKIFLAIFFQATNIPIASHLISLISFKKGVSRWRQKPICYHHQKTKKT